LHHRDGLSKLHFELAMELRRQIDRGDDPLGANEATSGARQCMI
jgi:hypothetical protein